MTTEARAMRSGLAFGSLAVLMAFSIAACSSGRAQEGSSSRDPVSSTENQILKTPRDQLQDGGTFTWAIDSFPVNFNYHELDGTDLGTAQIDSAMFIGAFNVDAQGDTAWNPDLLAAEPRLVLEPKQVVTYQINPKAQWYDGTPITWQDFYWQWKCCNGADSRYQIASSNGYGAIEKIERGADEREAVVTFARHYSDWRAIFSAVYPASTNKDPKTFNEGWKDRPLTTAGPFKLGSLDVTAKIVTLVRNERWWGTPAKLDRIVYRVIDPDAQIDAIANGEIDAVDLGPDVNKFLRAQEIEGADLRMAGAPNFRHLTINGTGPILKDVRVRRALAMAISRQAITRAMLGPLGIRAEPLNNHIFMENQEGYQDNSGEVGQYNPERARQLLDEAGWTMAEGGRFRTKNGVPLEIVAVIPSGVTTSKQETELMQNMLAQVGARLIISVVPSPDFFSNYITPGQFDFTVFSWIGTAFPMSSARSIYAMPTMNAQGQMDVQQNYSRIGSKEIDDLFDATGQELDVTKARVMANQIDRLIWDEVHSLTLYQRPEIVVAKSNLANFGAFGFADWVYEDIGWLKK